MKRLSGVLALLLCATLAPAFAADEPAKAEPAAAAAAEPAKAAAAPEQAATSAPQGASTFETVLYKEFTRAPTPESEAEPWVLEVCRDSSIAYVKEKGSFKQVDKYREGAPTASTAFVEAELQVIRIVSGSKRFWFGAFAGRSYMKMKVRLVDAASGKVVAEQEMEGAPNAMGSAWTFGRTDQALPAAMGGLIGQFVLANAGNK